MKVGSRESKLAMRQTEMFIDSMCRAGSTDGFDVIGMKALGDIDLTSPLDKLSNVGAFVRELDDALLRGDIDVSVNSMKDIPIDMAEGLTIGAVLRRDPVEDVMIPCRPEDLPEGSVVGTASVRRVAILGSVRPDLKTVPLRGNIHTRLSKLDSGECDAIILAKAGLERMGIERSMHVLDPHVFVPAAAQGAIAVECRADDRETLKALSCVDDRVTRECVTIERSIMNVLGAGCSSPVGINVRKLVKGYDVKAVSFAFTDSPIRVDTVIPYGYSDEDVSAIADVLRGDSGGV